MTHPPTNASPLLTGAGLVILKGRALFRILGSERASFLHGLVTNDIKKLRPGSGCRAAWLTPKGKMLADLVVLAMADRLDLDAAPALEARLLELLQKYGPFSPVEIENGTGSEWILHVAGTSSVPVLESFGGPPLPQTAYGHVEMEIAGVPVVAVRFDRGAPSGFDLRVASGQAPLVVEAARAAGAREVPEADLEAARIEAGEPRWGFELDEAVLPDEAGLNRTAISYTKGCYIGQETVARIKTYGHVNRQLVQLSLDPGGTVSAGTPILKGGESVGKVTSAATSLDGSRMVLLGYVKRELNVEGAEVTVLRGADQVACQVRTLPRPGAES